MAKSNRRRKLDRAKRQVKNSHKQLVAGRRQADEETIQNEVARYSRIFKPDTSLGCLMCSRRLVPRRQSPMRNGWTRRRSSKYWLDEHVPALGGRTPREAADAEGKAGLMLEAMLRQFGYEADVLAAQGQRGIDTDWLRRELGYAGDETDGVPEGGEEIAE